MADQKANDGKIKLSGLISTLAAFEANPMGDAEKAYNNLLAKLNITPYRRLTDKAASAIQILNSITADNTLDYVIDIACAEFAYGLLPYIVNLEDDLTGKILADKDGKPLLDGGKKAALSLIDPALYDLADRIGFTDYVRSHCEADYAELCHMVDRALNWRDVDKMVKLADDVSPEKMDETIKAIRAFKGSLSPEELKSMAQIASAADPAWLATKAAVADASAEAAMDKAATDSRPESERKAGAEAVAQYEAAKKAEKATQNASASPEPEPKKA
jgi:hypothetical protein